jgi:hypothetical protein
MLSIVYADLLPSNVGIYIGNGKDKWLHKEISRHIAKHIDR